jgi:cobyrinic acid a,c-diamide synthase
MVAIARLVIAAPASGSGKTTVACGLMAALRARGLAVSGHKVGPDYIDPGYHALATGRPPRNLDPFLCGEDLIAPLFRHGAAGAQVAVIEGVMGLFDGADPAAVPGQDPDFGSTAHVARLLGAPVVLVVDAARAGRSVAALTAGFAAFDPRTPVPGVILNRVASDRHERLLREALVSSGIAVYGAIRRTDGILTPSRHLGLIPAAERELVAAAAITRMGDLIAGSCDLDALLALARHAPDLPGPPWDPALALAPFAPAPVAPGSFAPGSFAPGSFASAPFPADGGQAPARPGPDTPVVAVVAVAGGAAFTFGYTEQCELLEAAGSRVASFDPLRDEDLPAGTSGLILGGGFPEVHAAELSANERLRGQVAALADRGAPLAAECAGLLYLARTLDGRPMCGVLDVEATMTAKLTLGYRNAVAATDSVLARKGDRVRGHEFHRTAATPPSGARAAWRFSSGELEGHVAGSVVASYLHTHWAGYPAAAARFASACAGTFAGPFAGPFSGPLAGPFSGPFPGARAGVAEGSAR